MAATAKKVKTLGSNFASSPLSSAERERLGDLTAQRMLTGPLEPALASEREALRLRLLSVGQLIETITPNQEVA